MSLRTKSERLRFLGLTQKSAARMMGMTQGTFDRKLHRCDDDVAAFLDRDAERRIGRMTEARAEEAWKSYNEARERDWRNRKR